METRNSARRRSEEQVYFHASLLDQVPNAVIAIDLDQTIVSWNSFAETLYQWTAEEAIGQNVMELILPDEERSAGGKIIESIREAGYWEGELVARRKDGTSFSAYVHDAAIKGTNGEVIGFVGVSWEISERKRLDRELQASEARFRSFMDHLPGFAWIKNVDGNYVYMNKILQDVLPRHRDDWKGRTDADFWPPVLADEYRTNDQRVFGSMKEIQTVERWIRNGQDRKLLVSKFPMIDAQSGLPMVGGIAIDITESQHTEQALRESQSHLQAVLDNCPAMIFLKDADGRYLQVNKRLEETFKLSPEQILGRTDAEVFSAELAAAFRATDRRVLRAGHPMESEEEALNADGLHTYIVHKFPLRDAAGDIYAVGGISTEITARKRDEIDLRTQKEVLQRIFDHIPVMISFIGKDGRIKLVNREWEHTLGWSLDEVLNEDIDVLHEQYPDPQDYQDVLNFIAAANAKWTNLRTRVRDGRVVDTTWAHVRLSDGTSIGIGQDITERKRSEEALRASEERYRDLVENANDIIYSHDLNGNYTSVNKAGERITGYSREEALNMNLAQTVAPEYLEESRLMIARKLAGEKETVYDLEIIAKDGHRVALEVNTRLIHQDGLPVGVQGIARDVTERKRAQEALRESEERYRDLVENSTELICTHDLNGLILSANRAAIELLGFETSDYIGKMSVRDILRPEVRHQFDDYLARLRRDGVASGLMVVQTSTGERRIWEYRNTLRTEGVVKPVVRGMARDITERKRAEKQIKVTTEQLRALSASLRSAREEEGTRIARELHDELGSSLTGLKFDLEEIHRSVSKLGDEAAISTVQERILAMTRLTDGTIHTIKRISSELRPSILDDLGLVAAIEWEAQQFGARNGILCQCHSFVEAADLTREQATAIFRVFQETLTNILRHAKASRVDVTLIDEAGEFVLEVKDDGRGITKGEVKDPRSLGLTGMRERVYLAGGTIDIMGAAGTGTVLTVRVPGRAKV